MKKLYLIFILSGSSFLVVAQLQQVRGKVWSQSGAGPVQGCTVYLITPGNVINTQTDSLGNYAFNVPAGSYSILLEKEGFRSFAKRDIYVISGKQYILDIELKESGTVLGTVTIKTERSNSDVSGDIWETRHLPAAFSDPARIASTFAGAVNTNDQSNNISVYGTTPNYIQWRMESVEIVNPNHLENSGTFNDRPALNGGGVCLLSAQLMQQTDFRYAPFTAMEGNALSGNFDIRLRRGNDKKSEKIIQAGLLGTDICVEGPFTKKHKSSYLVNYRYSTVGLLNQLGVDFGDERINYQDLSLHVSVPTDRGALRIFGTFGSSTNLFRGKKDSTLAEIQKDLQDIRYASVTGITGMSFITSLNNTTYFRTVCAYSVKAISRTAAPSGIVYSDDLYSNDRVGQEKISTLFYFSKRTFRHVLFKAGSYTNYFMDRLVSGLGDGQPASGNHHFILQPFVQVEGIVNGKLEYKTGLHSFIEAATAFLSIQPRVEFTYHLSDFHAVVLRYGKSSQVQPAGLSLFNSQNNKLTPTVSDALEFLHRISIKRLFLQSKLFYQFYYRVPSNDSTGFSAFNYLNEEIRVPLHTHGRAKVYGADFTLERKFRGFYTILSTAIFNSLYTTNQSVYKKSRFNNGFNLVLTTGREFELGSAQKFLSVNLRGNFRNGFRQPQQGNEMAGYTHRLPGYFRMDLRISYTRNRTKSSFVWALDIQNVTNRKNVAYIYYDRYTRNVETRYQLGLIPVLSFKSYF